MLCLIESQNLSLLNASDLCEGVITRHRKTIVGDEISVIDYILVCNYLLWYLERMIIDDSRLHVLTKYGKSWKTESDHNILYAQFAITYSTKLIKTKREIFNYKNEECQRKFFEVTNNTSKLSSCFKLNTDFSKQSKCFFKTLNGTFQQCFTKIRITNKTKKNSEPKDDVSIFLDLKTKLQLFEKCAKSETGKLFVENQIVDVERKITKLTAIKNAMKIKEHINYLQTKGGSFSQIGLWKLKRKLLPRKVDPPMGKKDKDGNLITGSEALKSLYIQTYVDRLKHREMKEEFQEMFELKTLLWDERMKSIKRVKSKPWTISDVEKVTKHLKNNQTRDSNGMINELMKPNIMGKDLKEAVLMNGIKENFLLSHFYSIGQHFFFIQEQRI